MSFKFSLNLLLFLCLFNIYFVDASTVIFLFGTSCAGKSSLSHHLADRLGPAWKLLDRDQIIIDGNLSPTEIDAKADDLLLKAIEKETADGFNLIVDTQSHKYFLEALNGPQTFSVLVYAPLKVLLERNAKRNKNLLRSEKRQFYALSYIFTSFAQIYEINSPSKQYVESISPHDIPDNYLTYCTQDCSQALFQAITHAATDLQLMSKEPYDIFINSQVQTIKESADQILLALENKNFQLTIAVE